MSTVTVKELSDKINKLRKEKDVLILAHLYENLDVQHVADCCGDSFELAKRARMSTCANILFCGVKFMAESAKVMNPQKHVYMPKREAGCAMADMVTPKDVKRMKKEHPNAAAVCYINSSAATKAECDMCVTSSNALRIIKRMPQKEIIFVPDQHLGSYIAERLPEKTFYLHDGYCPVHHGITPELVEKAKAEHPKALLLVHPECPHEIVTQAAYAGSTSGIINYAKNSASESFIIGTEYAVCERLQEENPEKTFYALSENLLCPDMKCTTLTDVLHALENLNDEIILDTTVAEKASICLERMMEYGAESVKK